MSRLADRPGRGLAVICASAVSTQFGAAVGSLAFSGLTPVGVVAVRQVVASTVLLALTRPRFWRFTRSQWSPVLLLALFFAGMNTALYAALERVGLGTAVTIEFLGPLAVAVLASRRLRDGVCAATALIGVVLLTRPGPTSDLLGLGFAVLAAGCWAGYILTNRVVGQRLDGVQGVAMGTAISALGLLPIAAVLVWHLQPPLEAFLFAAVAGVLASVVPYSLDLIVLRHISPVIFGLGMSLHPLFAALIGAVFLGQLLPWLAWVGILLVVLSNALILGGPARPRTAPRPAA
ncbi:EamA family transporter [Nesterenkonia sandarakina]|uniref:Inner membrane transporter RhtA n=1 Tax=Nesterenkonia sandarakina TaxID=272918 RepID=A0A7Z0J3Q4_9MICC|nr:inner membrane transporter RhtA [Nesterenkonia sandarakina]